ncbi:hypothetical protein GJU40_00290 [Bacillus lacus]|uniref:Flagellar biosynthesis protein FliZ n=1 Tax=Metabacillus lacus TaxID=1983721 RepID=A0A7X2IVP2_9BACI|nr:flagellar biosynthetic protein FliO [Metabacillus lacus]MRX70605.1 hypothetical protein [Metabacillus lacus]
MYLQTYRSWFFFIVLLLLLFIPIHTDYAAAGQNNNSVDDYLKSVQTDPLSPDEPQTDPAGDEGVIQENQSITAFDFFKMIAATGFVLFIIYFLLKTVGRRQAFQGSKGYLENLGGTSLGQNKSVQLVRAGGKVLILGVGESIQLLKEIDSEEEVQFILEGRNSGGLDASKAAETVRATLFAKKETLRESESFSANFKSQLSSFQEQKAERLKGYRKEGKDSHE